MRFDNEKLRASTYSRPMIRFILLLGLAAATWSALELRGAEDSPDASLLAKEKEISQQRMLRIYDAIQAYRKVHKDLPGFERKSLILNCAIQNYSCITATSSALSPSRRCTVTADQ